MGYVKSLELEYYLLDEPVDELAKTLDELIKKGKYE